MKPRACPICGKHSPSFFDEGLNLVCFECKVPIFPTSEKAENYQSDAIKKKSQKSQVKPQNKMGFLANGYPAENESTAEAEEAQGLWSCSGDDGDGVVGGGIRRINGYVTNSHKRLA